MMFSLAITVFLIACICPTSAFNPPTLASDRFFNLEFSNFCANCNDRCLRDQPELTNDVATRQCKCDRDCILFGDCCISFYTFCNIFSRPIDIINVIKSKRNREEQTESEQKLSDFKTMAQCESFYPTAHSEVHIWSINYCPIEYPDGDIKNKCTGKQSAFPLDIPVSIPALPYWLFTNVYCALCHNFTLDDVLYWRAEIHCYIRIKDTITTLEEFMAYVPDAPCRTVVSLPNDSIKVRYCDPELEPRCRETNQTNTQNLNDSSTDNSSNDNMNGNFTQDGNVSNVDLEGLLMNKSSSVPVPDIPSDLHTNDSMENITQANLDVLCSSYIFQHSVREGAQFRKYANPHCRACEVGWENLDRTSHIQCELYFGNHGMMTPLGSRLVRFRFGIFEKYIYFFSMESKALLESSHPKCTADSYFEFVTKSCELFPCPEGYFPYYQNCIPSYVTINSTSVKQQPNLPTLYIKTSIVILSDDVTTFLQVTDYVVDIISVSELSIFRPETSNPQITLPVNIKTHLLEVVKLASDTFTSNDNIVFVPGIVRAEFEVPVLFNDLNQTISSLVAFTLQKSDHALISNYQDNELLQCQIGRPKIYRNLDLNLEHKRAFVKIDDIFVDLIETKFTLNVNRLSPIQVLTVEVCRPEVLSGNNLKVNNAQKAPVPTLRCDNLTSELSQFSLVNESLIYSDKLIISQGDFVINGDTVDICYRAFKESAPSLDDKSLMSIFKNVASAASMILKVIAFIISLISRVDNPGTIYFQSLGITCSLIDFIHLLENLSFHNSAEILAILLHFAWLLSAYSLCAWCLNMICCTSKRTMKCFSRHLFISLTVPVLTIAVCATGDINTPPWGIRYGSTDRILSAELKVILYGYIIPFATGITLVLIGHMYRIARRQSFKKNKSFYNCHIMITALLILQFGLGCSETLTELPVYYFLYFTSSVVVAWSFLLIACLGLREPKARLSNLSRYLQSTDNNLYSVPNQSKQE